MPQSLPVSRRSRPARRVSFNVGRQRLQMGPDERAIREVHSTWIDADGREFVYVHTAYITED